MLVIAIGVTVASLVYLVKMLRRLTANNAENFFHKYLFRNTASALLFGALLTVAVQSSSITTSLIVPLVGAGVVTLMQAYPYTIGANIGTTATAIIASLATVGGEGGVAVTAGVTVAFSHLLFNLFGATVFLPLRRVPMFLANRLAAFAAESKRCAVLFVLGVFFVLPLVILAVSWATSD